MAYFGRVRRVEARRIAPVREERPVDVISRSLWGIAKQRWLEKWSRWIVRLLKTYNVEDVQKALGITDPTDLDEIEHLLIEHCSGLTESECLKKIRDMIRKQGYRENVTDEMIESMLDFFESVKRRPEIEYGFPPDIVNEIERLRLHPELNHEAAYKVVYEFLTREGVDPEEADRIAKEIARSVPSFPKSDKVVLWSQLLHVAKVTKQKKLDEFVKYDREAEKIVKEAKEDLRKDDWVTEFKGRLYAESWKELEKIFKGKVPDFYVPVFKAKLSEKINEVQTLLNREEANKVFEELKKEVVDETLVNEPTYRKIMDMIGSSIVKTLLERPWLTREEVTKKAELAKGLNILSFEEARRLGIKFQEARRTRTIEETVKVIQEWGRARGYKIYVTETTGLIIPLTRRDFKNMTIVYYPGQKPSLIVIECINNTCYLRGADKPCVAWIVKGRELGIIKIH